MDMKNRWAGVMLICLIALFVATFFANLIAEAIPHSEDEAAYLFQAQVLAENQLTVATPPVANAFWSPFVLDYNDRRFGKYPLGWPLLLSLGVRLNAAWGVNVLLGAASLGLIAAIGFCFYRTEKNGTFVGLLAAGLGLVTPAWLFQSGLLLSHAASMFWVAGAR